MTKLTKIFFLFLVSIFLITACKDNSTEPEDDAGGNGAITSISGTIQDWTQGEGYTVKLVVDTEGKGIFVAGESSINSSGKFNISNLEDVPNDFLQPVCETYSNQVNCDNSNAKVSINDSYLYVYDGNGAIIGSLSYESYGTNYIGGSFIYANSKVKVTGSYEDSEGQVTMNLDFKKGWNLYYAIFTVTGNNTYKIDLTSTHQDGMQWSFGGK